MPKPERHGDDPRSALRAARRALPPADRAAAADAIDRHLAARGLPRPGSRIAAYLPNDGEVDTAPLVARALASGCAVFVPVVTGFRQRRMGLAPLADGSALRRNRWGLWEPEAAPQPVARWLDLVLLPCVAFDDRGHRLGMGAGFYDRHFAFLRQRRAWRRPRLVALAYAFQQRELPAARPWDLRLDGVVTERGFLATNGAPDA